MRIFVFEYITGGGMLGQSLSSSLACEGDMMLRALVADLTELDGIEVSITRDARLPPLRLPVQCRCVERPEQFAASWERTLGTADAVWPIAPEQEGILEAITEAVLAAGKPLLSNPPAAVHTAASKIATHRRLARFGVPAVPTYTVDEDLPPAAGRWVLKPDDGVGCVGIRLFTDRDALRRHWERLPRESVHVAQPYISGTAASACILARGGEVALLSFNQQRIAVMDDTLVLLGCVVNGLRRADRRLGKLVAGVAAAFPELNGFSGVDIILSSKELQVVEINPRLTTSYVGLKESIGTNPAGLVLDLFRGGNDWRRSPRTGKAVEVCLDYADVA